MTEVEGKFYLYVKQGFLHQWLKLNPNTHYENGEVKLNTLLTTFKSSFGSIEDAEAYAKEYAKSITPNKEVVVKDWRL